MKTLTEDLVEASKASAGVLPVERQRLETCQLVEQALGEYAEKLTAAQLTVVTRYPKEGAFILADGRHLWRILDNLLSNCAKYAMPGTRVYVDVARKDGQVLLAVKNISADPLNLPAEELLQRFVRGDDALSLIHISLRPRRRFQANLQFGRKFVIVLLPFSLTNL